MDISVAIEFAASRTKVAWRDENNEIHNIDCNGSPYFPSVFHLPPEGNDILKGEQALEALIEELNGGIVNLKRETIENNAKLLFTYTERQEGAELLVEALFRIIRDACFSRIVQLNGKFPESLTIAIPAQMPLPWRLLIEQGALSIGVTHPIIALLEPVEAVRSWFSEQVKSLPTLLVLDCGANTTDLALVCSSQQDKLWLSTEFRPQSLNLGGSDVDKALYHYLLQHHEDIVKKQAVPKLLLKLCNYKESVLSGQTNMPFRIDGRVSDLDEMAVQAVYLQAFIEPLLREIVPSIKKIADKYPETELLLVGGGSEATALKDSLASISTFPKHQGKVVGLNVLQGYLSQSQSRLACDAGTNDKKKSSKSQVPEKWETPDIHGWSTDQVQQWQTEVAERLELPVIQQYRLKSGSLGPKLTLIPPGKYLMGSPPDEVERRASEGPQHQVIISKPYYMGQTALTFKDYDRYCTAARIKKRSDKGWGRGSRPVIDVSWEDAQDYCQWLSEQTGRDFGLPSEAQWEYACRAGTTTAFWWGNRVNTDQANYDGTMPYNGGGVWPESDETLPTEELKANPWGLYQVHGNVWEWCDDWFGPYEAGVVEDPWGASGNEGRLLRGGSWYYFGRSLRSAYRLFDIPKGRNSNVGFRIACSLFEPDQ